MDYLWMHGPLIEKESYTEGHFTIPATVEEVGELLPGSAQFDDIDDLLITIGKQHDRAMLHSFVSKLFRVPQRLLIDAEKNRKSLIPKSVLAAVYDSRKRAKDAAAAAASVQSTAPIQTNNAGAIWPKPASPLVELKKIVTSVVDGTVEYADPEYLCKICLPVDGDEIVGTRPEGEGDTTPKVHRVACPHAQRAINRALAEKRRPAADSFNFGYVPRVDSVTLRRSVKSWAEPSEDEIPVKLQWAESPGPDEEDEEPFWFPCEVVVHAQDRKLLLADCSEVVSELSQIIKTGSQTTDEHATLVFLINVLGLQDLQKVMDSLQQIRSVMSVERRVRSYFL
jgi:(p)ppGpp synthase/HD superfamily hydrolase